MFEFINKFALKSSILRRMCVNVLWISFIDRWRNETKYEFWQKSLFSFHKKGLKVYKKIHSSGGGGEVKIQKNATDLLNPNGGGFLRRLSSREDLESGPCENAPGYGRPWKWFAIFQIYLPDNLYLVTTDLVIVASVVVQPHFLVSDSVPIRVILRTVLKAILLTISHGHNQHYYIKNNWPVPGRKAAWGWWQRDPGDLLGLWSFLHHDGDHHQLSLGVQSDEDNDVWYWCEGIAAEPSPYDSTSCVVSPSYLPSV